MNSINLEDWQEQLKNRESKVVGNILSSTQQETSGKIIKSMSDFSDEEVLENLAKSWNTMNSTQDPIKKAQLRAQVDILASELKKR